MHFLREYGGAERRAYLLGELLFCRRGSVSERSCLAAEEASYATVDAVQCLCQCCRRRG